MRRAAEHCAELTRDLLAVAKRTPTQPRPVDCSEVIGEVVALLGVSLPDSVDLRVDIEEGTLPLHADPTQLRRVLTNLLVNARDAVTDGGRIDLRVRNAPPCDEEGRQRRVELEIQDTGVGMDRETRDHVFDPFFTTKSVGEGTGLGLSIVYGIVESHGATIEVDSEPDKGTCFRLCWPADESVRPDKGEAPCEPMAAEGHETVLLVEDEAGVRRLVRRTLEKRGYRVIEAEDGDVALERQLEHPGEIHLALLDFTMPGRDGVQTLEALRAREPGLIAILMSGHLDRDGLGGPKVEATFLPKPFSPDQLAATLREVLDA
jgi:CheY-like chemotaxis protein